MGKGGSKTEQTRLVPWDAQKDYLKKIFANSESLYGKSDLDYYGTGKRFTNEGKQIIDFDERTGEFVYSKDRFNQNTRPGMWGSFSDIDEAYADPYAPTLAKFTRLQKNAQNEVEDVARANLAPYGIDRMAENAIKDIINEQRAITPASMRAANIAAPTSVSAPTIGVPSAMKAADIGSTDLGYRYWGDLGNTVSGTNNQYLDDMVKAATRDVKTAYQEDIFPGISSQANAGGRYGSGAWASLQGRAANDYLNTIGDITANIRGKAYESDRGRALEAMGLGGNLASTQADIDARRALQIGGFGQEANRLNTQLEQERNLARSGYEMEAGTTNLDANLRRLIENAQLEQEANRLNAGFTQEADTRNIANILQGIGQAPETSQMKYADIGKMAAAGEEQQAYGQAVLDAFKQREEFTEMKNWEELNLFNQFIQGEYGGTTTSTGGGGGGKFGF